MKSLKNFYLEKKKSLLKIVIPKKNEDSQESLSKYAKTMPRLKKFREAEYFREEFMEPQFDEARLNA